MPTPAGMKITKASPSSKAKAFKPESKKESKAKSKAAVKAAPAVVAKKTPEPNEMAEEAIPVVSIIESADTSDVLVPKDSNCIEGETEAERARNASSEADKVFYYRRALRLCPKEPVYRIEMGRVYVEIGKAEEARFEFTKALELDPENEIAQDELSMLMIDSNTNTY
jgi:predicted Zn-dependent protease